LGKTTNQTVRQWVNLSDMYYILALDQGTTSSRAMLFDHAGAVVAVEQAEFAQIFPQPGWVEHDALEIWQSQLKTAQKCLKKVSNRPLDQSIRVQSAPDLIAKLSSSKPGILAIGITNQRETTVLWDRKTGQPLANAIVWQDRRTASRCDELRDLGHAGLIQQKTGLVLDAYFSATKLAWLLDNIPGARARADKGELAFGTMDSWLIWNLTGGKVHVTDASNASRTLLFNIHTLQWDDALLALFHIPPSVLPVVVPSSGVLGHTDASLFGSSIPIAGIAGDQQAATFGQACLKPGMAKNTYGTGCFMLMNTGSQPVVSQNKLLSTVGWQLDAGATYCLEGSVFMGGATIQWLRDGLQIIQSAAEVQALAQSVPDSGDVYLVPAFTGLGTPHWDPYARGAMLGLTRGTTRAHIARAALEAIALQSADVFNAMSQDAGVRLHELRVDGGASANNLLMQMQADFSGVPVVRPKVTETTALGAAYLAGLAVGFWSGVDEITSQWQVDRCFEPQIRADERAAKLARWHKAVARAGDWADG
jgi:glycerol kinase